eukprot:11892229-Alexandrium_andersonii.AAC.1
MLARACLPPELKVSLLRGCLVQGMKHEAVPCWTDPATDDWPTDVVLRAVTDATGLDAAQIEAGALSVKALLR